MSGVCEKYGGDGGCSGYRDAEYIKYMQCTECGKEMLIRNLDTHGMCMQCRSDTMLKFYDAMLQVFSAVERASLQDMLVRMRLDDLLAIVEKVRKRVG